MTLDNEKSLIDLANFVELTYQDVRLKIDSLIPQFRGVVTLVNREHLSNQDIHERIIPYLLLTSRDSGDFPHKFSVDLSYDKDLDIAKKQFGPMLQKDSENGYHL